MNSRKTCRFLYLGVDKRTMRMRMHWHVSKVPVRNGLVCDRLEDDFKSLVQMQNRVWLIPFVCRCAVVVFFSVVLQPIISIVLFLSPSHCYMNCSIGIFFFFSLSLLYANEWRAQGVLLWRKYVYIPFFLRIVRDQNWLQWLHGGLLRLKHWANYISIGQLYWHSSAFSKGRSCEMMFTFFFVLYRFLSFSYACFVCALLNCTCCVTWVGTVQPKIHRPKNVSGFRKSYHGFIFEWEKKHREMCVCVYLNCGHWYFLSAVVTLHKRAVEFHRQKKWKENTAQPNEAIQWFAANSKEKERKKHILAWIDLLYESIGM